MFILEYFCVSFIRANNVTDLADVICHVLRHAHPWSGVPEMQNIYFTSLNQRIMCTLQHTSTPLTRWATYNIHFISLFFLSYLILSFFFLFFFSCGLLDWGTTLSALYRSHNNNKIFYLFPLYFCLLSIPFLLLLQLLSFLWINFIYPLYRSATRSARWTVVSVCHLKPL
jgi:hypothetical protein